MGGFLNGLAHYLLKEESKMSLAKANLQHQMRMMLYVRIMDDKVKHYGVKDAIDLPEAARQSAWEEAVRLTNNTVTNMNAGFQRRN